MRVEAAEPTQASRRCSTYEIIDEYPEDRYLPSYLVYAGNEGAVYHVLFAVDVAGDNVRVITAYRPDPNEWDVQLRKRRGER